MGHGTPPAEEKAATAKSRGQKLARHISREGRERRREEEATERGLKNEKFRMSFQLLAGHEK